MFGHRLPVHKIRTALYSNTYLSGILVTLVLMLRYHSVCLWSVTCNARIS